jgi:hypothetical protein
LNTPVPPLSVTVITKNEAAHIAAALATVAWADEIVVVDCGALAAHDWILSIDADERVTPALAEEIRALLRSEPARRGYRIARVTEAFGRQVRGTDWYPDWQLRLYDRRAGRWDETRRVHESVLVDGEPGRLAGELRHHAYRNLSHHLQTIDRYTSLAAEDLHARGRRASWFDLAVHPPLAFLRNYLLRGGIRLGSAGLVISAMNSWYVFLKYAKLWEMGSGGFSPGRER